MTKNTSQSIIKIHPADNVAVALQPLEQGALIQYEGKEIALGNAISAKHKFALQDFDPGEEIIMYGIVVGKAKEFIAKGNAIKTSNVGHETTKVGKRIQRTSWEEPDISIWENKTFKGYKRSDGSVGTANYWLVFPLVFCENKNLEIIKDAITDALGRSKYHKFRAFAKSVMDQFSNEQGSSDPIDIAIPINISTPFKNVDGVRFLSHQMGCGGTRQDAQSLCGLLAGYATHPNVAGITVLSLGCQNAQFEILQEEIKKRDPRFDKPIYYFDQQTLGSEEILITKAIEATLNGMKIADQLSREEAPLSQLSIGLECGGSDGFSGISANPVLGMVSDIITKLGGTAILSEFPELCGVEQELADRCLSDEIANRFLSLMTAYQNSALAVGSSFDMNPSPGNIKDGLITDAMKSAGAAKKGGNSLITDVLDYPEKIKNPGLNLLCTPGNDVESTTALAASGANIILFTTGLGTPTGNPIVPVIKVASNTILAQKMSDIIDIDAGPIIYGIATIREVADEMLQYIIDVASGEKQTKAMLNEQYDFIPWKRGVSL